MGRVVFSRKKNNKVDIIETWFLQGHIWYHNLAAHIKSTLGAYNIMAHNQNLSAEHKQDFYF